MSLGGFHRFLFRRGRSETDSGRRGCAVAGGIEGVVIGERLLGLPGVVVAIEAASMLGRISERLFVLEGDLPLFAC